MNSCSIKDALRPCELLAALCTSCGLVNQTGSRPIAGVALVSSRVSGLVKSEGGLVWALVMSSFSVVIQGQEIIGPTRPHQMPTSFPS